MSKKEDEYAKKAVKSRRRRAIQVYTKGEDVHNHTEDVAGKDANDNLGENTGDVVGSNTEDNPDGNMEDGADVGVGDNLDEKTEDITGVDTEEDPGGNTEDKPGVGAGDNPGVNTGAYMDDEEDDPALNFIAEAKKGKKKVRMEDVMLKRSHWFHKDTLRKIDKLAKMTGKSKYKVIETAINSLYQRVKNSK